MIKNKKNISEKNGQGILSLLGGAIKQRRKVLRLTQGDLAAMAGMSKNLVCQIESGKKTVQVCKLLDLLSALGLHFVLDNGKSRILIKDEFLNK